MMSEGEIQRRLGLLLRTGCLLMESGADTSRVMRTMKRVAAYMGLQTRSTKCLFFSRRRDLLTPFSKGSTSTSFTTC